MLFQHFENNILADDTPSCRRSSPPTSLPGANVNTPQQTIQKRWQFRDDFSFRKEGWGGDHNFKVGAEVLRSHYGGFFIPTLYGYFNFKNSIPGANSVTAYAELHRRHLHRLGRHQRGERQLDLRGRLPPGRLEADAAADPEPRAALRDPDGSLREHVQAAWARRALAAAGYNGAAQERQEQLRPARRLRLRRQGRRQARGARRLRHVLRRDLPEHHALRGAGATRRRRSTSCPLSPPPFTPAFFAANRDAIRQGFLDPTFAGQQIRLTAPDLVQPYAHHANLRLLRGSRPRTWPSTSTTSTPAASDEVHRWRINTAAEREHAHLAGRRLRARVRPLHHRGQPRPLEVRRRLRGGQGAQRRSSR